MLVVLNGDGSSVIVPGIEKCDGKQCVALNTCWTRGGLRLCRLSSCPRLVWPHWSTKMHFIVAFHRIVVVVVVFFFFFSLSSYFLIGVSVFTSFSLFSGKIK